MPRRKKETEIEDYGPLSDGERQEILDRIAGLKQALENKTAERQVANGEYRAAIKAAGKRGLKKEAITLALAERSMAPEERRQLYSEYVTNLRLLGVDVGFQFSLFDGEVDRQTVANTTTPSDSTPGSQAAVQTAKVQGYQAAEQGFDLDASNPYGDGSPEHGAWRSGFLQAMADKDEETAPAPKTAAEVHDLGVKRRRRQTESEAEAPVPA